MTRLGGVEEEPVGEEGRLVVGGRARGGSCGGLRMGGQPWRGGRAAGVPGGRTAGSRRPHLTGYLFEGGRW